jgi:hypothetical protein
MSIRMIGCAFAAALFGSAVVATIPARADVALGTLTCRSPQPTTYILASATGYSCVFRPAAGAPQLYEGTVYRLGAQAGTSSNTTLVWAVFALTSHVAPGALAGGYGGASAGAALGIGARVNALVGGLPNAFALQPVSVEGENGINAVATVTGLQLRAVVHRARHRR